MDHQTSVDAAVAVSLALAAGMISQSLARHLKLPGIVLLLAAGVVLGPDVTGVVRPAALGPALPILVGFAVAVILFEGGLNLSFKRLRRQARVIQLLITLGAVVTAVGGTLAARWIMGWEWRLSVAFGSLVVVTGPTVVTPLLRRIKVKHSVETILEAEGVLIDAVGAVLAVVTLQVLISPGGAGVADGLISVVSRLAFGLLCGLAAGGLIVLLLRYRKVVPDGLENVFTLSLVLALFQLSNAWLEESGIMTVTAAGMVVGNFRTRVRRELMEFKEQLTVMLIGMLFVLLAANVRVDKVLSLGLPGILTVGCLIFLVRPFNILLATTGSDLTVREKAFLSWLAPRGIVAAAMASLFAIDLEAAGIHGGEELSALVFTVIGITVLAQGLSGGLVARLLGLRRPVNRGFAIFGASALGHQLGGLLRDAGHEVIFLERDPHRCKLVEEDGFRVIYGSILEERTMLRAQIEETTNCVTITTNQEVNLLAARTLKELFRVEHIYMACRKDRARISPSMLEGVDLNVLFDKPRDLELWDLRLRRGLTRVEAWRLDRTPPREEKAGETAAPLANTDNMLLPMVMIRGSRAVPMSGRLEFRRGDVVLFVIFDELSQSAREWFTAGGWSPAAESDPDLVLDPVLRDRALDRAPVN